METSWHLKSLCPATLDYVNKNLLSPGKIKDLGFIKKFVDRLATRNYLPDEVIVEMEEKFGEKPSMVTWGDYFQSEIAEDHHPSTDEEFSRVINTVRFDLIAAKIIFQNKSEDFFSFVDEKYQLASQKLQQKDQCSLEDEEYIHLGLLKSYFENLGLKEAVLQEEDYQWFDQFSLARAM